MRLMDVMMIFMWSPVCMGWKCEMCECDSLSTQFWAMIMSAQTNVCICWCCSCCAFFQSVVCGERQKSLDMCTDEIQSTKGRSDSSKRWIVVGAVVVGVVEIINAFFCNAVGLSHTRSLFMQLLTTLMATKQLHFNPLRNHFSRLTNDTSPVRFHSVFPNNCYISCDWSFVLSGCELIQHFWHVRFDGCPIAACALVCSMNGCDDE